MAIAASFAMVIGSGLLTGTAGVLMKPICEDLGFSRGTYSLTRTVISMVSIFFVPFIRKLIPKIGANKVLLIGAVSIALTNLLYTVFPKIWQFFIISAIQGVFTNALSLFVAANYINAWFKDSIGTATAIAYAGTGLGNSLFSPIINSIIEATSWRTAYLVTSVTAIVVLVPVLLFFMNDRPESVGLEKYTSNKKKETKQTLVAKPSDADYSMYEIRRMPSFYMLIIAFVLMSLFNNGPWAHTIAFLSDTGYSTSAATAMNSFYLIMLTVGKLVMGVMFDRLGRKLTVSIVSVLIILAPLAALFINIPGAVWIYCICLGFTGGTYTVGLNLVLGDIFGHRSFGDVLSVFTMITSFTGAFASPFMGTIFDITGSYRLSYMIFLVMAVISVSFILYTSFRKKAVKE